MPTKKQVLTFPVDADLFERISDFRFERRIEARSETIRMLIEKGLDFTRKTIPKAKPGGHLNLNPM